LARFLFRNVAAQKSAGPCQGGERLRAVWPVCMGGDRAAQLLILDEPTNHLDLDSIAAVEAALPAMTARCWSSATTPIFWRPSASNGR
jgi:ATPase subunit of ABC transporter with duplicated ATPase domains